MRSQKLRNGNKTPRSGAGCGKFDRPSLRDNDDSDSDEDMLISQPYDTLQEDTESEMENPNKTMYDDILNKKQRTFVTVEQEEGIKPVSQLWRLESKNVVMKRPKGMPYLLPIESDMKFPCIPKKYLDPGCGRVQKPQRKKQITVEKGNLIYRMAKNGDEDTLAQVVGIQTKKKPPEVVNPAPAPPMNIMLARFFGDLSQKLQNNPMPTAMISQPQIPVQPVTLPVAIPQIPIQPQPIQPMRFVVQPPKLEEPNYQMKEKRLVNTNVSYYNFNRFIHILNNFQLPSFETLKSPQSEAWICANNWNRPLSCCHLHQSSSGISKRHLISVQLLISFKIHFVIFLEK